MEFIKEPGVEIIKKWKRVKEKNIAIAVSEEHVSGQECRIFELIDKSNDENKHIEAYGITARIVWRVPNYSTIRIFADYFSSCKQDYCIEHNSDSDAWRRDLGQEFCRLHINEEKSLIESSLGIYKYLSDNDVVLLKGYIEEYLKFVENRIISDNADQENVEFLNDYFCDVLRLQHEDLTVNKIKKYEDKNIVGDSCYVGREMARLRSYLLDIDREDRGIILENITEELLYAYFAVRNKIDSKDPHDINRSLMLLYDEILLQIIMLGWGLRIRYSDKFVAEWKIRVKENNIVSILLGSDKSYSHLTLSKGVDVKEGNVTFHSVESKTGLTTIFNRLKTNKYLDADSSLSAWLYICGQNTESVGVINWVQDQQLLAHLIDMLFGDSDRSNLWSIAKSTFTIKGKELNINSMKNAISKIRVDHKDYPKSFSKLDNILRL